MLGVLDVRRRGVARALMSACFERARHEGKTFMTLHTTERMVTPSACTRHSGSNASTIGCSPTGSCC